MKELIAGWLVAALLPVLPGAEPEARAKVHATLSLCETMQEDLEDAGANIIVACRYTTGQETIVIKVK